MITTSQFKRGSTVEVDGTLYKMEEVNHVKTKKSA
ncbi:MAG TPA: elongation factor P, partial [Dehalococcoidia bacterium]|nr:elongation factor P [Dehalococcoidia bacterium]